MFNQLKIVGKTWLNSQSLTELDTAGKVVLIDFWTYSCVNCLRTIPHLRDWWHKYRDKNFLLIGVHTPEFEFEKDAANVEQAVKQLGVDWPVVLDNDYLNWHNFANQFWPAKYLIDQSGRIVYHHFGEGSYEETEEVIQTLLKNGGRDDLPPITSIKAGKTCFHATPELYCGHLRGELANRGGYVINQESNYALPEQFPMDQIALAGRFLAEREYVESREEDATLCLNFQASEINLVMAAVTEDVVLEIKLNNQPLPLGFCGDDVNEKGEVMVREARMYRLLKTLPVFAGLLTVTAKKGSFRAYAFTFSGCMS